MNILIIEDEPKTAKLLKELIEEVSPLSLVLGICESVSEGVKFIATHQHQLDLIFMDIQLTDGTSFEIFKQIEVEKPVVFCTAYDQYSLEAFKSNGIDYVLKPFSAEDIEQVFVKIGKLKNSFSAGIGNKVQHMLPEAKASSILIKHKDKVYPLAISEIACFFIEHEMVYAYDYNGGRHPVFRTMNEIQDLLDNNFFRVNRQVIVSRNAVVELEQYFLRKMVVRLKFKTADKIIIGKTKVSAFMAWLEG